jgi:hypothetical protein
MNCEFISKIRQFNLIFSVRVRKKTYICLRNGCAYMQTSNEIPARLQCKKQSVVKTSSPSKGGQFNPALYAHTRMELYADEGRKKLENVVYFYYADLCWQAQKSRAFENLTGVFTILFSDSQTLYLT